MTYDLETEIKKRNGMHLKIVSFLPDMSTEYICKTDDETEAKKLAYSVHEKTGRYDNTIEEFENSSETDDVNMFLLAHIIDASETAEYINDVVKIHRV